MIKLPDHLHDVTNVLFLQMFINFSLETGCTQKVHSKFTQ